MGVWQSECWLKRFSQFLCFVRVARLACLVVAATRGGWIPANMNEEYISLRADMSLCPNHFPHSLAGQDTPLSPGWLEFESRWGNKIIKYFFPCIEERVCEIPKAGEALVACVEYRLLWTILF